MTPPNLINGKIPTPGSAADALRRRKQLAHEMRKITAQLDDPARALSAKNMAEFDRWKASAKHAWALFKSEDNQLALWLEEQNADGEVLLRRAYALIKTLSKEVDFEYNETELLKQLDTYFQSKEEDHAAQKHEAEARSAR